jgi:tetratricopeptide (TPR) repeat protein
MEVFISYHRSSSGYLALIIQQYLQGKNADVFLDVSSLSAGRFEAIIMNEIRRREHFIVVFSGDSAARLSNAGDWVGREVTLALQEEKNVIPILADGARLEEVPEEFQNRSLLLEQNALTLSYEFMDEALEKLYSTYLCNPTIQERNAYAAEERYTRAIDAKHRGDWPTVESEIEDAIRLVRRPEYYLLLGVAKHWQGRDHDAIADIESAMRLDPFGWELMNIKFQLLQGIGELQAAIHLYGDWDRQARSLAQQYGRRILALNDSGKELVACGDALGALGAMHCDLDQGRRQLAVLQDLFSYASEEMAAELHSRIKSSSIYKYTDDRKK